MNVLQVENLIRSYRKSVIKESEEDVKVLKGISFQVAEGEFVGIMGKSGCGKTTLLKTLGMIDKPTDGTIKFMGEDTSELYGDKLADIRLLVYMQMYTMDLIMKSILLRWHSTSPVLWHSRKLCRKPELSCLSQS